jgi:hypothetical protein
MPSHLFSAFSALLLSLLAVPAAAAEFTLEREDSNWSPNVTHAKSVYVVTDGEVALTAGSRSTTATFTDVKEMNALLAVIRATKDDQKPTKPEPAKYRRGCLIEGKTKRCSTSADGTSPRLDALLKLEQVLIGHLFR